MFSIRDLVCISCLFCCQNCEVDSFQVTTTSNIYPSSDSVFSEKVDFCHVIGKIDRLCKVKNVM